jgi:chloramphenicol O-acetyltransferase type A
MPSIDLQDWPRKATHDFFLTFEDPWFNITAEVDVTRAWKGAKDSGTPFSLACWYAVLHAINDVENLRLRLRPEGVWLHDRIRVGGTAMKPDGAFTYVYYPDVKPLGKFVEAAKAEQQRRFAQEDLEPSTKGEDDLIHATVVPWIRFTAIKHARLDSAGTGIPKVALGKATETPHGRKLPVSLSAHHALVDGVHAGAFFSQLQVALDDLFPPQ